MKKKILVVDDEETIRDLYRQAFEIKGYTVFTAESAEKALEILKQEEFKVMFLDLMLPGMDGLELCREIRKRKIRARIFAVTGHPSVFEVADCRQAGFDGYFTKPISLLLLCETAEEAMKV